MSGVWTFKNGFTSLVKNQEQSGEGSSTPKKVLVHLETGEIITSYATLENILTTTLGWERYFQGDTDLIQFHKRSSIDLISLPKDFSKFTSTYMYDLVVKNPNTFQVKEA